MRLEKDKQQTLFPMTPQPLYNTIAGVQTNSCVSYPIHVIMRKMYRHMAKIVQLGSNNDQCYVYNRVVMNHVIKRSRCISNMHSVFHGTGSIWLLNLRFYVPSTAKVNRGHDLGFKSDSERLSTN